MNYSTGNQWINEFGLGTRNTCIDVLALNAVMNHKIYRQIGTQLVSVSIQI